MRSLLAALFALMLPAIASAETVTSRKDSLGYTHYSSDNMKGISRKDSLGQTHSDWNVGGKRSTCLSRTDSLGITKTNCH